MAFKFLEKLSQDLTELLNDKEECNIVIEVDQEQNKKTFTAHSAVLRYRSSYFNKELANTIPNDDNNNIKTITKPNISSQIFEIILKYIYGGIIDTENMDTRTIYDFMEVANELEFEELSEKLENHLIESKASWLKTHFTFVYHSIFKNNKFQNLKNFCNNIIAKHPNLIFEYTEFTSLPESALVSILNRDDLQMKESEIWDYLIKWGISRNPTLPEKLKEWSDENFMTLKTTLSQDLTELLNDKEECNIVIEVDQEQNKKTFTAHSAVLRYRSSYFNKELANTIPNDDNNNIKTITKPNISSQIFEIILKYIYGGIIDTENMDTRTIYDFMEVANELEFEELSEKLENHLIESKASWLKTHFTFVYHSIFKNNKFQNLKNFCNNIIAKHPNLIFEYTEFTSLPESALVSILNRDDLQMKESEIWDYLIKWGISRNPTLPEKLKEWSDENFMTLKTTVQQCLPLIRYFHVSSSDVMDKVKPYKKILDKQLWNDLKQFLLLPDRPVKSIILPPRLILTQELSARINESFSTIINEEHTAIISSWIDYQQTSYSSRNNPYEWELILRGSKDGFAPRTFWDICDGHANTIVITKVKGTDEIIGGFNPLAWDKAKIGDVDTNKSFIFSFKGGNIHNSILSRVQNSKYALYYYFLKDEYGPCFGYDEFIMRTNVSDFTQDKLNQCCSSIDNCYEKSIRTTNDTDTFSIIDYEVFKVVNKSI
ncbi:hypothetical protein Glove_217g283 [Diversispora epigaea]|uniref:BTB domain-containing protein n=1 Tax=Diversispora epigaea TaxID=1348612 RepID=A0A397IGI1_9GLOM|nr:hypothetical protein Glove_217g283 [Diversispora epigaea]